MNNVKRTLLALGAISAWIASRQLAGMLEETIEQGNMDTALAIIHPLAAVVSVGLAYFVAKDIVSRRGAVA